MRSGKAESGKTGMSNDRDLTGRPECFRRETDLQEAMTEDSLIPLGGIHAGQTVRLVHIDGGCTLRSRLAALGLLPGVQLEMVRNSSSGPFVVAVKGSRLALGRGMARHILVS